MVGLMKEIGGSDHFAAGMVLPSGNETRLINAIHFVPHPDIVCESGSGNSWNGTSWSCSPCEEGKYSDRNLGEFTCSYCPLGRYSGARGATSKRTCLACEAGEYSNTLGSSSAGNCKPCEAGKYDASDSSHKIGEHWIMCGRPGGCSEEQERLVDDSTSHEVRCCSDIYILGWSKKFGCPWAASSAGFQCQHVLDFQAATAFCSEVGGRLCTKEEIGIGCTAASGYNHDTGKLI